MAKTPVVSSKVILGLNRPREQPLCVVSDVSPFCVEEGSHDILTFRTLRASRVSTLRTPSRAGKWACVDVCFRESVFPGGRVRRNGMKDLRHHPNLFVVVLKLCFLQNFTARSLCMLNHITL